MESAHYDCAFKILLLGDSGVGKSSTLFKFIYDNFEEDHYTTIGVEFASKIIDYHEFNPHNYENKKIKLQIWDTAGQERFRSITKSYFRNIAGVIMVFDITRKSTFESLKYWLSELEATRGTFIDTDLIDESKFFRDSNCNNAIDSNNESNGDDTSGIDRGDSTDDTESSEIIELVDDNESDFYSSSDVSSTVDYDSDSNNSNGSNDNNDNDSSDENSDENKTNKNGLLGKPYQLYNVRYPPIILVGNKSDLSSNNREIFPEDAIEFAKNNYFDYYIETSAKEGINVTEAFTLLTKSIYQHVKRRGHGLEGVINPKNINLSWYELEAYNKRRNTCCNILF